MYSHVILGGTFDHIHKGHEVLLHRAFSVGKRVTIGLTSDKYVLSIKYKACLPARQVLSIKTHEERKRYLVAWLRRNNFLNRSTIVPIHDSYGPSISDSTYDAIVVSKETEKVSKKINALRLKRGVSPLTIIVILMVPAQDAKRISSTRIRNGEIDHDGKLMLPNHLRATLAKPIGVCIPNTQKISSHNQIIISVGDTTTAKFLSYGILPTLAIIDFQARRQAFDWNIEKWQELTRDRKISYFTSGPGFINKKVMRAIEQWSKNPKKSLFIIDGEEGLLVLPAILYAPLGSIVYYGQPASPAGGPDKGIIEVIVTEKMKNFAKKLLSQFK